MEAIAWRERAALDRLARIEARFAELCPPHPTFRAISPDRQQIEEYPACQMRPILEGAIAAGNTPLVIEEYQLRLARMEAFEAERDALFRRLRIDSAVEVIDRWFERLVSAAHQLTFMPPSTPEGLAAKARAWLTMKRLCTPEFSFDWANDLAEMTIRETMMLGGMA